MKKEVTLGQVLSTATVLIIALVTGWITLTNKVAKQEAKDAQRDVEWFNLQMQVYKKMDNFDKKLDRMDAKGDAQAKDIRDVLIELQNKANRK